MSEATLSTADRSEPANTDATMAASRHDVSGWLKFIPRLGYVAKGVVYITVGVLALLAAFGSGEQTSGSKGAIAELLDEPFGAWIVGAIAVGLFCFVLWRATQVFTDPEHKAWKAGGKKGFGRLAIYLFSGIAYTTLAIYAATLAFGVFGGGAASGGGGGGGGGGTQSLVATALGWGTVGLVLVVVAGLAVVAGAFVELGKLKGTGFMDSLKQHEMSEAEQKAAKVFGYGGLSARAVVFAVIGVTMLYAAWTYNPNEATGMSGVFDILPHWLLIIVALGLALYGGFSVFKGVYRRLPRPEQVTD